MEASSSPNALARLRLLMAAVTTIVEPCPLNFKYPHDTQQLYKPPLG
jgi:hypothetical protein